MENLKLNHRYLVKPGPGSLIVELIIVEITKTSVKVKYENGTCLWYHKKDDAFWEIVEDLGLVEKKVKMPVNPTPRRRL